MKVRYDENMILAEDKHIGQYNRIESPENRPKQIYPTHFCQRCKNNLTGRTSFSTSSGETGHP